MKKKTVVLWIFLVIIMLTGILNPTASVQGQSPLPEALGPGWHQGSAEPVSPAEARQVLSNRGGATSHTLAALPSSETEVTPEIQALARALEDDPKLIFDYVHNHVDYVPTFGSVNGATATLLAGRGNDWDQTSLFVALMRAAGYTANYVVGDVTYSTDRLANWLGVDNAAVDNVLGSGGIPASQLSGGYRITRAWAEAEIGGQTYIFDPAMKSYTETTGIDLATAIGYDYDDFMTRAQEGAIVASDLVQDMNEANIQADLTTYSMNLVTYIRTQMPDATLAEVIGGREIVAAELSSYPISLPYALEIANEWTSPTVPEAYRHTLRVEHRGIDHVFRTYEIAGKRISIFYDDTDNDRPVLRVDGTVVATGDATSPGGLYDATLTIDHAYAADGGTFADQWATTQLQSGAAHVIVHDFNTASDDLIARRNTLLSQYTHAGYAHDSEPSRGEGLWLMGLNYFYENHLASDLIGQIGKAIFLDHHTVGWMTQDASYSIDLPLSYTSTAAASSGADIDAAYRTRTMMTSALEHGMLEQMQGSDREAVSTIKALQLNNQLGNMTFLADASNWSGVKPNLKNYWPSDLAFVEDRIYDGYTLLLPEYGDLNLNQWYGSGYMGYKGGSMGMWVGGTYSGGMVTWLLDISLEALLDTLKEFGLLPDQEEETKTPESDDPVDMVTGAFHFTSQDIVAGPSGLLDVTFKRSYNSGGNYSRGPLGYGWSHNQQVFLASSSDYAPGLGQRQPTDAAAFIVFAQVTLDVLEQEETIKNWMTADLATKWAMDQLIDNAITVHLSATSLGYVRLADGSYNPPPGIHQALVQEGDYTYVHGGRNGCMIFDAEGRGRVWTDANGNSLTYTYDGDGRLLSVGNPDLGQSLVFTYTGTLLTAVADQAGRSVAFEYTNDELVTFRDAEGHASHYGYDDAHRLTTVTTPRGNTVTTNVYDALGRVITQTDALDNTTTFYFSGHRNVEAHPDGGRIVYYVDDRGLTIVREDLLGNRMTMDHDGQYQLRTVTDREGSVTTFDYHPASGEYAAVTNSAGHTTQYTYTPQQLTCINPLNSDTVTFTSYYVEQIDYPDGSSESYTYYDDGDIKTRTDQVGQTWTYEYNHRGQVSRLINPVNGVKEYTYNTDGTLASSTDSDLGVTTYGYDAYLRQTQVTHPDGHTTHTTFNLNDRTTATTDERNNTTTYQYDPNGNLQYVVDAYGKQTTYTFNAMDLVWQTTDRRGNTATETYDEMNRLETITGPNDTTTTNGYDPRGWLNQTTDPAGKTWQTDHNEEGVMVSETTPQGFVTSYSLDSLGNTTAIVDPLGHATTYVYDEMNRVTAVTDPLGRTTAYDYDGRGLLTGVTLPDGTAATYEYDERGLLATIHAPGGHDWTFTHTSMGQLQNRTDPLGNQWEYDYNQRGLLTQVVYPTGDTQARTYDAVGNLTRQQYSIGPDLHYTYDDLNRLVATDGVSLTYNAEGQVTATTDHASLFTFDASYDNSGRLETVAYADGLFTVTYQYDARDLLTRVSDDLTGVNIELIYDDDGRLIGERRSNGVDATFTWDDASRLTRIQEGTLIDLHYTYNAAGEVTQAMMDVPLDPGDYIVTDTIAYTFDNASQISNPGFVHDARGRLTADPEHTYTWDGASRLRGVDGVSLTYNGLGNLLTRTESSQTTRYHYNHALRLTPIVAEQDADSGEFRRFYVWTPSGNLLYMIDAQDSDRVYFYHFDRNGSTLALTNQAGNLTDAYVYEPYGRLLHHQGDNVQPFTYVGQWGVRQEGNTGALYHMRTRYYDARTSRFLTRDMAWGTNLENASELNTYIYAACNPCAFVDPMGTSPCSAFLNFLGILKPNKAQVFQGLANKEKLVDTLLSFIPGSSALERGNLAAVPGQVAWDILAAPTIASAEVPAKILVGLMEYGEPDTHGMWSYSDIYDTYLEHYGDMPMSSTASHVAAIFSYPRDMLTSGVQASFQTVHAVGSGMVGASAYVLSGIGSFLNYTPGTSSPIVGSEFSHTSGIPALSTQSPGTYNAAFGAQYDVMLTGQVKCH